MEKFKKVRQFRNLSLKDLAKIVGISPSHLSMIENGKRNLTYYLAVKLAVALDSTPDDLFFENFKL